MIYGPEPAGSRWVELPGDPMPLRRELAERRARILGEAFAARDQPGPDTTTTEPSDD